MMLGHVADSDLRAIYRAAALLVYPSLYEGFGIPPLEAMACGTPVVTSNTTSLPEVVGDAAVLVDPLDTNSIAAGIRRVLSDPELRQCLGREGPARAALFDWDCSARKVYDVLKRYAEA
jgi:glycosyltransferase involved in cell wall biosynthesis